MSLFSSTSTRPLDLFSKHTDSSLPSDSVIQFLNDTTSNPPAPPPAVLIHPPELDIEREDDVRRDGYGLCQTVLHMQSPTLRTTYIRCPPSSQEIALSSKYSSTRAGDLGIKHPWLHIQVRSLGREWSCEVGVVDKGGRVGVIRCSTFQKHPVLKISNATAPPLLHLPLTFPPASSHPLTSWATVTLDLASLMHQFTILSPTDNDADQHFSVPLPSAQFSHVSFMKVYANCRLRRIWFSESRKIELPWEFRLYSSS